MAADPLEQMRADRERRRREAEADRDDGRYQRDWRHDTLDLDPVVPGEVVRERTRGRALHAGRRVLRSAVRSAGSAPRRVPAGLAVGVLLLAAAGAVSAVASEGPLGWPSGVTQAPSSGPDTPGAGVVVGDDGSGAAAAPAPQDEPSAVEAQPAEPQAPARPGLPGPGGPGGPAGPDGPGGPGRQAAAAGGPEAGPGGGPGASRP